MKSWFDENGKLRQPNSRKIWQALLDSLDKQYFLTLNITDDDFKRVREALDMQSNSYQTTEEKPVPGKPHKHAELLRYAADHADAEFICTTPGAIIYLDGGRKLETLRSGTFRISVVLANSSLDWRIKAKTEVRYQWAFQYKFGDSWEITELHYANGEGINHCYQAQRLDFTAKEFEI